VRSYHRCSRVGTCNEVLQVDIVKLLYEPKLPGARKAPTDAGASMD
jgi:hypothetical protein